MATHLHSEMAGTSYLVLPNREPPHPGVVIIHEVHGLNDNIRDICRQFAAQGYAALGVDLLPTGANPSASRACLSTGWPAASTALRLAI
jgi:carboxymethylenebutenolidase